MNKKVELVVEANCVIGECPLWDDDTKALFFIDLLKNNLHRYSIDKKDLKTMNLGQNTGCIALRKNGGLIAGLQNGIYFIDKNTGESQLVASPENDKPGNRSNDGKCDPAGRFWIGTMSKSLDSGYGDYTPRGAVYCMEEDLSYKKVIDNVTISNGLAWTKDNKTMLYIDSPTKTVAAYDYDIKTGIISNKRIALDFSNHAGIPDGMCIDSDDKLWIAFFGGGCLCYCDPSTGIILDEVNIPAPNVACPGFGGENYDELYITTGNVNTDMKEYPLAGAVFKLVTDVPGLPPVRFKG